MFQTFSNIIYDRLCTLAEKKIDDAQTGFRTGYSTTDNIFQLQSMVQRYTSKAGGRFYVLCVDIKQVLDGLIHHKLFASLHKNGIQES